jgi:hypothetical protein
MHGRNGTYFELKLGDAEYRPRTVSVGDDRHRRAVKLDAKEDIWWSGNPRMPELKVPTQTRLHRLFVSRAQQLLPAADRLIVDGVTVPLAVIERARPDGNRFQLSLLGLVRDPFFARYHYEGTTIRLGNARGDTLAISDPWSVAL